MNNFLFEAVCSQSSKTVREGVRESFGKGNTSPDLDRSVKMNPLELQAYWNGVSYYSQMRLQI